MVMKRLISLLLACLLVLGMSACGGGGETTNTPANTTAATQSKDSGTVVVVEGETIAQLDNVGEYIGVTGDTQDLKDLPAYTHGDGSRKSLKVFENDRYGQTVNVLNSTTAASFINYLKTLEAEGWEQYSNNIIAGTSLFATYTKDGKSVYCYYIPVKKSAYIITSPQQNLEAREADNQYEKVCTPLLTQVKLLCQMWQGGMSYVMRLSDGRFVVVDGGYIEANNEESKRLYALMEQQNVLDKITIAAWIATHPHSDHLGVMAEFLRNYNPEQVEIQQMIYNFPCDAEILEVEAGTVNDHAHGGKMQAFLKVLKTSWPDTTITQCHTGQVYHIADAKIEFLHTYEDFYPTKLTEHFEDPINGTTSVFRVELGGQKIMFYGDANIDASKDLVKMWGDYLKSDFMQANHHGLNGGRIQLYEVTDPTIAMVPMCESYIPQVLNFEQSRWLWNNGSGNIKELVLSGWEQRVFELPYTTPEGTPYFSAAAKDPWAGLDHYKTN